MEIYTSPTSSLEGHDKIKASPGKWLATITIFIAVTIKTSQWFIFPFLNLNPDVLMLIGALSFILLFVGLVIGVIALFKSIKAKNKPVIVLASVGFCVLFYMFAYTIYYTTLATMQMYEQSQNAS